MCSSTRVSLFIYEFYIMIKSLFIIPHSKPAGYSTSTRYEKAKWPVTFNDNHLIVYWFIKFKSNWRWHTHSD